LIDTSGQCRNQGTGYRFRDHPATAPRTVMDDPGFGAALPSSRHDLFDDLAVHVGQPIIAAGVAERELLVVRAKKVQDHRVQVVDLTPVLDGLDPSSSVASRLLGLRPSY